MAKAQRLQQVCQKYEVPLRAAALQFPLAHSRVACVVVGARSPDEVKDTVAMMQEPIPVELWTELKSEELLRSDAPVPMEPREI